MSLDAEWGGLQHQLQGETASVVAVATASAGTTASAVVDAGATASAVVETAASVIAHPAAVVETTASAVVGTTAAAVVETTASAVVETAASAVVETTGSAVSAAITAAIMSRADEISLVGNWIGMLEIMAFCALRKQRVLCELQDGELDVMDPEFAPRLMDATWKVKPFQGRIVACKMVGSVWQPASWKTCTHFVAAKPLERPFPLPW